jgi:ribonucleoside-diphosphate reductase alpha chain
MGLPYDSESARATAAALTALFTAEAFSASAELAALRGPSDAFIENRETVMRALRNHRRAAFGDGNDYERLTVPPAPLALEHCADLALASTAQHRWDEAIEGAQAHGLRAISVSELSLAPHIALFMENAAQGFAPLKNLFIVNAHDGNGVYEEANPCVADALLHLGYGRDALRAILRHLAGTKALLKAPSINHESLKQHGFDTDAIARIEAYLPYARHLRFAVTPWVVGMDFCLTALDIPASKLNAANFDLLHYLGFSDADIAAANLYCYGHGDLKTCRDLRPEHWPVFACEKDLPAEAVIRMAASLQGFVSGEVGLAVALPVNLPLSACEKILLSAWRQGVKSLTLSFDPDIVFMKDKQSAQDTPSLTKRPAPRALTPSAFLQTKSQALPLRRQSTKTVFPATEKTRSTSKNH